MLEQLHIERFESCNLETLNAYEFDNRTDTKFVFSANLVPDLIAALNANYQLLYVDGDWNFTYYNTYLDSLSYTHYLQHHAGKGNRKKYRIRKYAKDGMAFFEEKEKNNKGVTSKLRTPIRALDPTQWAMDQLASDGRLNAFSDPTYVTYQRLTFLNKRTRQKLTVDFNLQVRNTQHQVVFEKMAIAEVKQVKNSDESAAIKFFKQQKIRPTSFSKYCMGLALINTNLKSNRFKPTLLKIKKITPLTITSFDQ